MSRLADVVKRLASARCGAELPAGRLELSPPASDGVRTRVHQAFGAEIYSHVSCLLDVTSGMDLIGRGDVEGCPVLGLTFDPACELGTGSWSSVYPLALEFGAMGETLYWDVADRRPGPVFFTNHDGPYHWYRFESLADCLEHFLIHTSPHESVLDGSPSLIEPPRVSEFEAMEPSVREFLARYPSHYRVIDFRSACAGVAFSYDGGDEMDSQFTRLGTQRLWVQRKRRGAWERLLRGLPGRGAR